MGIASLGGILSGAGNVKSPNTGRVGADYMGLLNSYLGGSQSVFNNQAQFQPQYNALATSSLGSTSGGISNILSGLLPSAGGMVRNANPGQAGLLDSMTQSASQQLAAGASLDPSLARVTQQSIRGGQAARGLGYGPSDVLQESSALTQLGDQFRQERQGFASNVAGMNSQYETQPTLGMLMNILQTGGSLNSSAGPTLAPASATSQLLTMPYQGRLQANSATASNNTGLYQSMDSNQSSFISGL